MRVSLGLGKALCELAGGAAWGEGRTVPGAMVTEERREHTFTLVISTDGQPTLSPSIISPQPLRNLSY